MPQVTVYIRKEDMGKWKELANKAEWISNHLRDENYTTPKAGKVYTKPRIRTKEEVEKTFCPHGNEIGKCTSRMCNSMLSR